MAKARVSVHRGKNGSAVHNAHDFMGKDKNTHNFWRGKYNGIEISGSTPQERELDFYKKVFTPMLEEQNDKYRAKRNYDRVKTIEDIYKSSRYKPTEEVLQYGGVSDRVPDKETYKKMINDYWIAKEKLGKGYVVILTASSHFDESTPHTHMREIFVYKDDKGIIKIGQEEALKRAGFELPNPNEPEGRYNNRLMTYTKACREKWQDICEAYGYEVERTPKPVKKRHQTVKEFQDEASVKYFNARESDLNAREEALAQQAIEIQQSEEKLATERSEASQKETSLEKARKILEAKIAENKRKAEELKLKEQNLDERSERLKRMESGNAKVASAASTATMSDEDYKRQTGRDLPKFGI